MKPLVYITLCTGFAVSGTALIAFKHGESQSRPQPPVSVTTNDRTILATPAATPASSPAPNLVHRAGDKLSDFAGVSPQPALHPITTHAPPNQRPTMAIMDPPQPTRRAALEQRARMVEHEANRELERLLPLLDLSPQEQDRIFAIFAVTSPHFDRAMEVGSNRKTIDRIRAAVESGASIEQTRLEEVYEAVDEVDQIELADTFIEKEEWWTNIVADLEAELDDAPLPTTLPNSDEPILLASPDQDENPADDEISVTRPTVFPSE